MVLWYWTGHINLLTTVWFQGSCFSHIQEIFTGYHGCRDQTRPLPLESLQSSWNSQANGQSQHRSLSISLSFQGSWDSALGSPRSSLLQYRHPPNAHFRYITLFMGQQNRYQNYGLDGGQVIIFRDHSSWPAQHLYQPLPAYNTREAIRPFCPLYNDPLYQPFASLLS